jgi:hypothetical protein
VGQITTRGPPGYRQIPRKQDDGDGDGDPLDEGLGVPLGLVAGEVDGDPLEVPPPGVPDPPPLGVELVPGRPEGLADGFLPPGVVFGLAAPGVATVLGPAAPPAGPDVRAAPDALCDGVRPVLEVPAVEGPAGTWFAVGEPLNAPETSSATRPALAAAATPTATTRRRGFPCGWPGCPWPGCPGPGGFVGSDMRGGTFQSSETRAWPVKAPAPASNVVFPVPPVLPVP